MLRRQVIRLVDNSPRFQRWIGFWMLGIALGCVMTAETFGLASAIVAAVTVWLAVWLFQKADDQPERIAARNAEIAHMEARIDGRIDTDPKPEKP